ncbi:hypothetical protein AB205_0203820, partial [Aquarana catesbeiana]
SFPPVKSGDKVTITISLFYLKPERHNMQKILEVTKKMMELLTGEVSRAGNSGTLSMEDLASLKGHNSLYKDVMMENQPPLTSSDGSSNGNPPERCPCSLYSWDSTQEGHTIPHHHQVGNLGDYNIIVKKEYKEEDEEYGVMKEFSRHKDLMNSTQEGHTIPHHHQSGNLGDCKVEVKTEEEKYVRDDQQSMEEDGIMRTFIEEDTPTEISTDDPML